MFKLIGKEINAFLCAQKILIWAYGLGWGYRLLTKLCTDEQLTEYFDWTTEHCDITESDVRHSDMINTDVLVLYRPNETV